jgi:cyanophycinase-like exopeptidase
MKIIILFSLVFLLKSFFFAQNYTSYFTGNTTDLVTTPTRGICLMGGASEYDDAMRWFLNRANGGDVLVLRASGADGYNDYFYTDLGITLNSVETIVFNNANASIDPYIWDKINKAEAIWFAGGDQWNYISYWRDTPIDSLINKAIVERNIVIGGTSAGMAIQGEYYFSAQNGSVTSATSLNNPYGTTVTPDGAPFLNNSILSNTITDTHFDNPDRRGRLTTFMARIYTDHGVQVRAIACEEYVAVCIDENGIAKVYGEYPAYDEEAYFIQTNCSVFNNGPENCVAGQPLTWNHNGQALIVYDIKGTPTANNSFDLNDWTTGTGGTWLYWSANNGVFTFTPGAAPDCSASGINNPTIESFSAIVQHEQLFIEFTETFKGQFNIVDLTGKVVYSNLLINQKNTTIPLAHLSNGIYIIEMVNDSEKMSQKFHLIR